MSAKSFFIAASALAVAVAASPRDLPRDDAAAAIPNVHLPLGWDLKITTNLSMPWSSEGNKTLELVFDSGSENFWVFGPGAVLNWGCTSLLCVGPCNNTVTPVYNYQLSPTASKPTPFDSFYAYGSYTKWITGSIMVNDTMTFTAASGLTSTVQDVSVAVEDFMSSRNPTNADGTCGTANPSGYDHGILGVSPFYRTPEWNTTGPHMRQGLLERGVIKKPVQSMWFDEPPAAWDGAFTGNAVFGAVEKSKFKGPLVKVPVRQSDGLGASVGYFVAQPNVTVGGVQMERGQLITAVCHLDSGTTVDDLPVVSDAFFKAMGMVHDKYGSPAWPGACDTIPLNKTFELTFPAVPGQSEESVTVSVPLRHYARPAAQSSGQPDLCNLRLDTGGCMLGAAFSAAAYFAADDAAGEIALAQGGVSKPGSQPDQGAMSLTI